MKTNHEHIHRKNSGEAGNALIYVLIAIVLFGALSFTLTQQTGGGEAGALSDERAKLYATELISYAAQAKSSIDQMMFAGATIEELDFTHPTEPGFNTPPHVYKVYHPEGGGLNPGRLADAIVTKEINDPPPGWYLGRFNNIDWTKTEDSDVILVAYQIDRTVCQKINETVKGSPAIPVLKVPIKEVFIYDDLYARGNNKDLTTDTNDPDCEACYKVPSLCVQNNSKNAYAFYNIIAAR